MRERERERERERAGIILGGTKPYQVENEIFKSLENP